VASEELDGEDCAVCLQAYQDPVEVACRHRFCKDCLTSWLQSRPMSSGGSCPLCRREIRSLADVTQLLVRHEAPAEKDAAKEDAAEGVGDDDGADDIDEGGPASGAGDAEHPKITAILAIL